MNCGEGWLKCTHSTQIPMHKRESLKALPRFVRGPRPAWVLFWPTTLNKNMGRPNFDIQRWTIDFKVFKVFKVERFWGQFDHFFFRIGQASICFVKFWSVQCTLYIPPTLALGHCPKGFSIEKRIFQSGFKFECISVKVLVASIQKWVVPWPELQMSNFDASAAAR